METKDYLTNYYERYDENGRLISKHGMIEYITTMDDRMYCDTGERITMEGAPVLAMFKKTVSETFDSAGVSLPMIYEVEQNELQECLDVIHQSFRTVADQFGLTKEICPKHTSFIPLCFPETQKTGDGKCTHYMPVRKSSDICRSLKNATIV